MKKIITAGCMTLGVVTAVLTSATAASATTYTPAPSCSIQPDRPCDNYELCVQPDKPCTPVPDWCLIQPDKPCSDLGLGTVAQTASAQSTVVHRHHRHHHRHH